MTATALERAGHVPVILDSLDVGPGAFVADRVFYRGDIAEPGLVARIVADHPDLRCTIHLAARTVVPESVDEPELYRSVNVDGTAALAEALAGAGRPDIVFSSSAAVYGPAANFEVDEDSTLEPGSPYARTKVEAESLLASMALKGRIRALALRYFNPIGSDPDLRSGVHVRLPSHVLGQLVAAAAGEIPSFRLTGTDFPTRDGTGLRDYVHVWDVARAHVAVVERLDDALAGAPYDVLNVGTGRGTTVRELVAAFEKVVGRPVPVTETSARPGDVVGAFANVDRIRARLGWHSELTVEDGIASALAWAERRPEVLGYP